MPWFWIAHIVTYCLRNSYLFSICQRRLERKHIHSTLSAIRAVCNMRVCAQSQIDLSLMRARTRALAVRLYSRCVRAHIFTSISMVCAYAVHICTYVSACQLCDIYVSMLIEMTLIWQCQLNWMTQLLLSLCVCVCVCEAIRSMECVNGPHARQQGFAQATYIHTQSFSRCCQPESSSPLLDHLMKIEHGATAKRSKCVCVFSLWCGSFPPSHFIVCSLHKK